MLAAGASHTVDRNATGLAAHIEQYSQGSLDAVADLAGGPLIGQLLPLIRDDGRWVIAGAVAGPVVELDLRRLYLHNIRLIGSSMHTRNHFAALAQAARSATVDPVVANHYALEDIAEAQEEFRRGHHIGKIVLTVN